MIDLHLLKEESELSAQEATEDEYWPMTQSLENTSAAALKERLRKTLRYGRNPTFDRSSYQLTELAVELLQDAAPKPLGRVDMDWASLVSRQAAVSPCAMLLALIYVERLRHRNPNYLQNIPSSDLFLVSMMVASKYLYDEGITEEVFNDEWAESANMEVSDLNEVERNFLSAMDWSLFVHAEEFWGALNNVEGWIAKRAWQRYGVLTYLDLEVLSRSLNGRYLLWELLAAMAKVVSVCSVAYIAGTLTLVTSPFMLTCAQMALTSLPTALPHYDPLLRGSPLNTITNGTTADPQLMFDQSSMESEPQQDLLTTEKGPIAADHFLTPPEELNMDSPTSPDTNPEPEVPFDVPGKQVPRSMKGVCVGSLLTLSLLRSCVLTSPSNDGSLVEEQPKNDPFAMDMEPYDVNSLSSQSFASFGGVLLPSAVPVLPMEDLSTGSQHVTMDNNVGNQHLSGKPTFCSRCNKQRQQENLGRKFETFSQRRSVKALAKQKMMKQDGPGSKMSLHQTAGNLVAGVKELQSRLSNDDPGSDENTQHSAKDVELPLADDNTKKSPGIAALWLFLSGSKNVDLACKGWPPASEVNTTRCI